VNEASCAPGPIQGTVILYKIGSGFKSTRFAGNQQKAFKNADGGDGNTGQN
jgi:hypothetical protein